MYKYTGEYYGDDLMITLGKTIYKLTGLMTKKQLVRTAKTVGESACAKMQQTGRNLSSTEIGEILGNVIGKKAASKIEISGDKASLVEAIMKNFGVPRMHAEGMANQCLSAALGKGMGSKTHLNLQVAGMPLHKSVNLISLETEHALHRTFSFDMLISKLLEKTSFGRKILQKQMAKSTLINEKNLELQGNLIGLTGWSDCIGGIVSESSRANALLEITRCSDKKMLQKKIRDILYKDKIIEIGNDKQNNFVLKTLIGGLKDESRAYNAGAYVENLYRQSVPKTSQVATTRSEVIADIYDEAIQVMKKERKHIRRNRLKEFFGLKVNRKEEQEIINETFKLVESTEKTTLGYNKVIEMFRKKEIPKDACEEVLKINGLKSEEIKKIIGS